MSEVKGPMIDISPQQFENICRCCLNKNAQVKLFIYEYEGLRLNEILIILSLLHLDENDNLPQTLCQLCVETLVHFYSFKKQVEYSETVLKNSLIKKEPENAYTRIETDLEVEREVEDIVHNSENALEDIPTNTDNELEEPLEETSDFHKTNKKGRKRTTDLICPFCHLKFDTYSAYRTHRLKEADKRRRKHPCSVCKKMISTYKLKDHINSHTKESPYECNICGEKFRFRSSLTRHNFKHAQKKPHECHICGKGFIQAPTLTDHLRTHTGEKTFMCNICGKSFVRKHSLANHIHMHKINEGENGLLDLSCKVCSKTFTAQKGLKRHMLIHDSQKNFLCSYCGKKFSTKHLLDSHIKLHSDIKPYSCEICNKGFAQKCSLQKHQMIHTGEKPEVCFVCGKKFSQKSHLTYHMRKHSGERPYLCTYCNKSFDHTGSFKIHIRIHTGEKPYTCNVCSKAFYDSSSLKKHSKGHIFTNSSGELNVNMELKVKTE